MRLRAKTDDNQKEIVEALRRVGASVESLHRVGKGCPDLLVGCADVNVLIEVKMPGEKLTRGQLHWFAGWQGKAVMVTSAEEALAVVGEMKRRRKCSTATSSSNRS